MRARRHHHAADRDRRGAARIGTRRAELAAAWLVGQRPRPLFKRRWFKFTAEDYGFYNHMPAAEARALLNDDRVWRSYFKFAFERNPVGPAGLVLSPPLSPRGQRRRLSPSFIKSDSARADQQLRDLFDRRRGRGRFRRPVRESGGRISKHALAQVGLSFDQAAAARQDHIPQQHAKPYRDYYDDDTRAIVGDWYAREIELLDYEF